VDLIVRNARLADRSSGELVDITIARMAAALSFRSTVAHNAPLSSLISTEAASATLFMSSTDAPVNDRMLLSPDIENVTGQGLVIITSDNRSSFLFPIQGWK
jgi:hypothetical protein